MKYDIKHTTPHYIRIRFARNILNDIEAYNLKKILLDKSDLNIKKVIINKRPASLIIEHNGIQGDIEKFLDCIDLKNLNTDIPVFSDVITSKKELYKRMAPELRQKLRNEIMLEAAMDVILPAPIGIAYHMIQLASL